MTRIGIVTVSDRASAGAYEDRSGPAVRAVLDRWIRSEFEVVTSLVPDERDQIAGELVRLADDLVADWVITTGGTGPAPRDVTPEAVVDVAPKVLPGIGERMRRVAPPKVPTAILSRQIAAVRGKTLIVALPGNPKAIAECLDAVLPAIPHCLELVGAGSFSIERPPEIPHP